MLQKLLNPKQVIDGFPDLDRILIETPESQLQEITKQYAANHGGAEVYNILDAKLPGAIGELYRQLGNSQTRDFWFQFYHILTLTIEVDNENEK